MNAICFFTFRPPKQIFDFAKKLKTHEYNIFVSINDNNYIIPEYDENAITIIKLDDIIVKDAGYFNSNNNIRGHVCSRDKAFYYFNKINTIDYKFIWFIEEDVFIPTTKTINNIDIKYPYGDYLSNSYFTVCDDIDKYKDTLNINLDFPIVTFNNNYSFHESSSFREYNLMHYFNLPWLKSMSCAIRVSKNFLEHIDIFVKKHNTLFFDEVLYPTISLHNNLVIVNPIELTPIVYRCDFNNVDNITNYLYWNFNDIREDYLFHPIKDLDLHQKLRDDHNFN